MVRKAKNNNGFSDFFNQMEDIANNEFSSKASDKVVGDITHFIDSGNYAFNAALSGDIFGGIPGNKITTFAGPSTTGKTFLIISCLCNWQKNYPDGEVFYFESEGAITKNELKARGLDLERIRFFPVITVEDFRTQILKIVNLYLENFKDVSEKDRPKIFLVLDSLGQLSTKKEIGDIESGDDKVDMTKAKLIRGAFRALTLKLSVAGIPLLVANHSYSMIGAYGNVQNMGGGEGTKYASTQTIFLRKSREKDSLKEVNGVTITATVDKSRITREGKKIKIYVDYEKGLDRYSGLLELGEKANVIKKLSNQYEFKVDMGELKNPEFGKNIMKNPEKYFNAEVLNLINEYVNKEFKFGNLDYYMESDKNKKNEE